MTKRSELNEVKSQSASWRTKIKSLWLVMVVGILGIGFWVLGFAKDNNTVSVIQPDKKQFAPFPLSGNRIFENPLVVTAPSSFSFPIYSEGSPISPPFQKEDINRAVATALSSEENHPPPPNWSGDGLCYQQGFPTGRTGSNFAGIACDGLHTACRTDAGCVNTGFCFEICVEDICICEAESCIGKCGFDAYIWDPETDDCGCNTGYLKEEKHAEKRCEDLGGKIEVDGKGKNFCAYNGFCEEEDCLGEGEKESCKFVDELNKQAWTQYENWSATSPKTCTGAISGIQPTCTTGAHSFGNQAIEECRFVQNATITARGCGATLQTCKAQITQIGCTGGSNCRDAGGEEASDGVTAFCKINRSSCPAGWTQYQNWSATNSAVCSGTVSSNPPFKCTTSSHTLANDPARETCEYLKSVEITETSCANIVTETCTAPVTQVGCF